LPEGVLVRSTPTDAADVGTSQIVTRFGRQQYFFAGALALLLAESFLAWIFGRGL
jgi:hypothetical protein